MIPYEDDNTVIKYIVKAHLYLLVKLLVSSQTVDLPVNDIHYSKKIIDKSYAHVNRIHIVNCHHLYMNKIHISLRCYQDQMNLENIQQQYLPFIIVYLHPNVDSVFLYRSIC